MVILAGLYAVSRDFLNEFACTSGRVTHKICVIVITEWQLILGWNEKMQPRFVDFQNFAQGFGFADRDAIFEAIEFS